MNFGKEGKEFENITRKALLAEKCCFDRLPDQMTGNAGSVNPGDFTAYLKPNYFYIECKSCKKAPFDIKEAISEAQWVELLKKARPRYPGVYVGYLVCFYSVSRVFWIPAIEMEKLYKKQKTFKPDDVQGYGVSIPVQVKNGKLTIISLVKSIVDGVRINKLSR